jgi:mannonate dehydratase
MPVLDWTRTNLDYEVSDSSTALRFEAAAFAAFELFLLKRPGATEAHSKAEIIAAKKYLKNSSVEQQQKLIKNIIAGLPGAEEGYTLEEFNQILATYKNIGAKELKANLFSFVAQIIPAAEQAGVLMCIHPDDPPYPILGLPRVLSTEQDVIDLYDAVKSPNNGLTFCTGSFGVRADNDFHEANHLEGDVDMFGVMKALIEEQILRQKNGRKDICMPFRPDHGHKMLDDLSKKTNPGYSGIGRLRGLAELRGLELGIRQSL